MNLDPIYVFTCTCTLVILDNCWFWDSISAIPHLRALFILAKTHSFLFPRILSNHINLLCHTSIIALAKLYNFYKGNCNSSVFFSFFFPRHFASTSFCFVFCFGGQSGVRKSKHKTNPEGIGGGGGCAGARPGREERGPACVLRPRALGPAWPGWAVSCCTGRR